MSSISPPFQGSKWGMEFPIFFRYNKCILLYPKHIRKVTGLTGEKAGVEKCKFTKTVLTNMSKLLHF